MASLNLLRYLVIKDCESDNQVSSIWFENDWWAESWIHMNTVILHSKSVGFAFFFAMVSSPVVMFLLRLWEIRDTFLYFDEIVCIYPFTLPVELWSMSITLEYITTKSHTQQVFPHEKKCYFCLFICWYPSNLQLDFFYSNNNTIIYFSGF